MNRIIFPLEAGRQGPEVADLQERVAVFDEGGELIKAAEVIREAQKLEFVDLVVPVVEESMATHHIEGRILKPRKEGPTYARL